MSLSEALTGGERIVTNFKFSKPRVGHLLLALTRVLWPMALDQNDCPELLPAGDGDVGFGESEAV